MSPLSTCECIDSQKLKEKLYPKGATDMEIRMSIKDGYKNRDHWVQKKSHKCLDSASCPSGFYWNELACNCFSDAQCLVPCKGYDMPTEHCGCTDDKKEYLSMFPSWANEKDISQSIKEGRKNRPKPDPTPPALKRP